MCVFIKIKFASVNLPICKYTPVCICVRMHHLLTPSKICTPEYIYTCVFFAHAKWTLVSKSKKVQVGKDQEKAQSKKIPTPKTEVGKNQTNNQVLIP